MMLKVSFYHDVDKDLLKYAVIVSKFHGKWVFCKHRERNTYECPGGHRENGENILETAKRELYEETGAIDYSIQQLCVYSVQNNVLEGYSTVETFGMLYYADIFKFEALPNYEIEKIELFDALPNSWTYPEIQPILVEHVDLIINL